MTYSDPIPFSAELENIEPEKEADTILDLDSKFDEILETTYENSGHAIRSVHAKSHGIAKGTLTIEDGLRPELAQGLFAHAGQHDAYIRMSTNAGDILHDNIHLPRGFALKVCDVKGARLPDADGDTQDFIFVNAPAFAAPNAQAFAKNLGLLAKTTDRVEWLKKIAADMFKLGNDARQKVGLDPAPALASMGGVPQSEPVAVDYFSATPFRYGRYVAKFHLRPAAEWMKALAGQTVEIGDDRDGLRHHVREQFMRNDAEWDFCVQLLRDVDRQPVEDSSVEWPQDVSPFEKVATLRIPKQDSWDEQLVRKVNETMRFSVWTGVMDHLPMGNTNRARQETYRHSARFRSEKNGCPMHEPG